MATDYRFESFDVGRHNRQGFSCTEESLERYLQQARKDQDALVARVFVYTSDASTILGYYTLSNTSIKLAVLPDSYAKKLPKYQEVPAVLLGRLAVDAAHLRKGYGGDLLIDALRRVYLASLQTACWCVVVDALHEKAAEFYRHYDFVVLPENPLRLFLPLKTISKLFEPPV
jgi:GNAT superfamily N-acetyltransferase